MSGIDDLVCAIAFTLTDALSLVKAQKRKEKQNALAIEESLEQGILFIRHECSKGLDVIGPRFSSGDEISIHKLTEITFRIQLQVPVLLSSSPTDWAELWDLSETTRIRTLHALRDLSRRMTSLSSLPLPRLLSRIHLNSEENFKFQPSPPCYFCGISHFSPPSCNGLQVLTSDQNTITIERARTWQNIFNALDPLGLCYISGEAAQAFMRYSCLPDKTLGQIWKLAEIDVLRVVTRNNLALALVLIDVVKRDGEDALPRGRWRWVEVVKMSEEVERVFGLLDAENEDQEEDEIFQEDKTQWACLFPVSISCQITCGSYYGAARASEELVNSAYIRWRGNELLVPKAEQISLIDL